MCSCWKRHSALLDRFGRHPPAPTKATPISKESNGKDAATKDLTCKDATCKDATCKEAGREGKDDETVRRNTAVTLNYCRASFYRIQKCPTLRVLVEEQEKILNNVDLNGIADQEVIKLYTGVLVEISEIRLSDRERLVLEDKYHNTLGTLLTADAFDFGTQLASAHYLSAVRTGARSWWDYRTSVNTRDLDVFHVDQKRLMAFTEKSGQFLDTFWKLARDRKIPDRWLIRNQDLHNLEKAMQEHDPSIRLRVLKRMQDFMVCFPPYWYYVARTQQALGRLACAAEGYERLVKVGQGHFRKDEMLAAGLANRAMILDYLRQPGAVDTALKATRLFNRRVGSQPDVGPGARPQRPRRRGRGCHPPQSRHRAGARSQPGGARLALRHDAQHSEAAGVAVQRVSREPLADAHAHPCGRGARSATLAGGRRRAMGGDGAGSVRHQLRG